MDHYIKTHATTARVLGTPQAVYVFSCAPCKIWAKAFSTPSRRKLAIKKHLTESSTS